VQINGVGVDLLKTDIDPMNLYENKTPLMRGFVFGWLKRCASNFTGGSPAERSIPKVRA